MKKILFIAAAAVFALASCAKQEPSLNVEKSVYSIEASINAGAPEFSTKLSLDGLKYSWADGDRIFVLQYNSDKTNSNPPAAVDAKNVFTYSASDGCFKGSLNVPCVGSRWFVYSHPDEAETWSVGGSQYTFTQPSPQTGKAEDIGKYLMFQTEIKVSDYKVVGKEEHNKKDSNKDMLEEISFKDTTVTVLSPVIKLNVPAELGLTKIGLSAVDSKGNDSFLTGKGVMKASSSYISTAPDQKELTVYRDGEVISGDVYFTIFPDVTSSKNVRSSAHTLTFSFAKADGSAASFTGNVDSVNKPLLAGSIYNFGTVPTNLVFTDSKVDLTAPSDIHYVDVVGSALTYTAKINGSLSIAEGKDSVDYVGGIEFSADGVNWEKLASTVTCNADRTALTFSASKADLSFKSSYKFRTFGGLKVLGGAGTNYSEVYDVTAGNGSYVMFVSLNQPFSEKVQTTSSGVSYEGKAFFLKDSGYRMIADGDLYWAEYKAPDNKSRGGIYFNYQRFLSLPAPLGMKLTDAFVFIGSSQKNATIFGPDKKTKLATKTNKSTTTTSASYDPYAISYYHLTPEGTEENTLNYLGSTANGTYKVHIPEMILFYTPVGEQKTVDSFNAIEFGGTTTGSINVTGGSASDYVCGFEMKDGDSWTKCASSEAVLSNGVLSFSTTTVLKEGDIIRMYAYPAAGTYEDNVQYGPETEKPGMVITYDFANGCPFTKCGTEKTQGAFIEAATENRLVYMLYNPRSGYDFPTAKQSCSSPKNVQGTLPTVSNGGACTWGSYTSGGSTTTQWWTCYPMTKFLVNAGGVNYEFMAGTSMEMRDAYLYYDSSKKALVSNKIRLGIPKVPGYKVSSVSVDFTTSSATTTVTAYLLYLTVDTTKENAYKYTQIKKYDKVTESASPLIFDSTVASAMADETKVNENSELVFASDNTPIISKVTIKYTAVETKSSLGFSNENVGAAASYKF